MPLTEESQWSLQRFGCALQTNEKLILVNWADLTRQQALAASILVRTTHRSCPSGPALCLALEISPTRILPRYSFFSFDLLNPLQMDCLASISATNCISINFIGRDFEQLRNHELTRSESDELRKSCESAKKALSTLNVPYAVIKITDELESNLRIPQLFERAISESDFARVLPHIMKDTEKIPPDKRALSRKLVRDFADQLRSRYEEQIKKGLADIPQMRLGLASLLDLQRIFGNDYDRFTDFFGDAVAFSTEQELLDTLNMWAEYLDTVFKVIQLASAASQATKGKALRDLGKAFLEVLKLVKKGRELSLSMLHTLLRPLKPLLLSQPGRPPKDYSREYDLKRSGRSWSQVARQSLIDNEEIREEFKGRTYDSLDFEQREALMKRIQQGVKSYAERERKPFPIESNPKVTSPDN